MADFNNPSLIIFETDLRTVDNPALDAAVAENNPIIGLFIWDENNKRSLGAASRWWLHHSLKSFEEKLQKLNIPLILKRGDKSKIVQEFASECAAKNIFWNRLYDKAGIAFGTSMKNWCDQNNINHQSFNGTLLHEPYTLKTKAGGSFKVFTPFWKTYVAKDQPWPPSSEPDPRPAVQIAHFESDTLADWDLLPRQPNWAEGFFEHWQPGQDGALEALDIFLTNGVNEYAEGRDFPNKKSTSKLSPHLRFGEISPRQIWFETKQRQTTSNQSNAAKFLSEVGWREFAHHLLFHCEDLESINVNRKFDNFSWYKGDDYPDLLKAWQKGQTGYPLVDAGMRELWQTGWMHNRVRMVVGSFLVKHLLIDWREGEKWFWDTLLDACPANNTAGWQWIAGCGADAAPYFRIFNPITQSEKFDKNGDYIRRFVPELSKLPDKLIHKPWTMREDELALCDITLGETYPHPIVDHAFARERALKAFGTMKQHAA